MVVLTWNGREDTLRCLEGVVPQLGTADRIHLVDNASTDGTLEVVEQRFPDVARLRNPSNLGFAGGNNPGLDAALAAGADWVLVLNNDTIVAPGTLDGLRTAAATAPPTCGVLQPLLVRADDPRRVDSAGHELLARPGVRDLAAGLPVADLAGGPVEVFGACAAAALCRADALRQVGGFDEDLFVLFEDVDLMFRLRAAGWSVLLLPSIHVRHARGVSGRDARAARRLWVQRNLLAIALRYWPTGALLRDAPRLCYRAVVALRLDGRRALRLWRRAWRERARNRAALRAGGVDRFFGDRDDRPGPTVGSS